MLVYPGAQLAAVYGLVDLFAVAGRSGEREVEVVLVRTADGLSAPRPPLTVVIVPPSLECTPGDDAAAVAWLRARHAAGALLCSVCAGAFLLAHTGLLTGRAVTTHWGLADAFAARFPDVALDVDRLLVDDGDIVTAGGMLAWVDLGLRLVERLLGPAVMLATARYLLADPGGREQRFYSVFAPALDHGDPEIVRVQRWLQTRSTQRITLPMMAARAGLGERTFLRRFVRATGRRPTEYVQHLRVGRARALLERSRMAIEEVARRTGYEDAGAFRKIFQRIVGLSPGEYRRRFTPSRV